MDDLIKAMGDIGVLVEQTPLPAKAPSNQYELCDLTWDRATATIMRSSDGHHTPLVVLQTLKCFWIVAIEPLMDSPLKEQLAEMFVHKLAAHVKAVGCALIMQGCPAIVVARWRCY